MAKGFYSELPGMRNMPNKYEYPDDMKSTTDEKKAAVKAMNKKALDIAYLYQKVDTRKGYGCIAKACSDKFPGGIVHKSWNFINERFSKSGALSALEIIEEMSKRKLK